MPMTLQHISSEAVNKSKTWHICSKQESQEPRHSQDLSPDKSPGMKDMKDIFQHSKNILGKMLSPAKDLREKPTSKWFNEPIKTEVSLLSSIYPNNK